MKQSSQKSNLIYYIAYSTSYFFYGAVLTALGPLIPFLAAKMSLKQTQFAFIFFCRSLGFILAGFLIKKLAKILTNHHILLIVCLFMGSMGIVFSFLTQLYVLGFLMFLIALGCGSMEVMTSMSLIDLLYPSQPGSIMQIISGIFSIGGVLGPVLVYFWNTKTYMFIGIGVIVVSPFYIFLKSPEILKQIKKEEQNEQNIPQVKIVPSSIQYRLCALLFLYLGIEISFGGWVSSYSVLRQITSKQNSANFSIIFWVSNTIFRFIIVLIPGKMSNKLKFCAFGTIAFIICGIIGQQINKQLYTLIISSIGLGLLLAPVYPYIVTLSTQFKMQLQVDQRANIMISGSLGQTILSTFIGYLMKWFSPQMLFFSLLLLSIIYVVMLINTIEQFGIAQNDVNDLQILE